MNTTTKEHVEGSTKVHDDSRMNSEVTVTSQNTILAIKIHTIVRIEFKMHI